MVRSRHHSAKLLCIIMMFLVASVFTIPAEANAASKTPGKPTIKVTCTDYTKAKITWGKVKYATKYQVYRATSKSGSYKSVKTTTAKSYTNSGLTSGKTYYYKVRALNGSKKGSFSAVKSVKIKTLPAAKFSVKDSVTNITLSVTTTVKGATGYEVYRADENYATKEYGAEKYIGKTTTKSYVDRTVELGKTYSYRLRPYKTEGKTKSYIGTSNTAKTTVLLPKPKGIIVDKEGKITLKCTTKTSDGIEGFKIYRCDDTDKDVVTYNCIGTFVPEKTYKDGDYQYCYINDKTIEVGTEYFYMIQSYKTIGDVTAYSEQVWSGFATPVNK